MEFSAVIDRLDDLLSNAKKVKLGSDVRVDKEELAALVRQLRGSIPEEFTQARWISENRDDMLAEARQETAQILEEAREERARILGADEVAKAAERRAQEVLEEAERRDERIREEAEQYALAMLEGLEAHLTGLADAVARGRDRLAERREGDERRTAVDPPGDQIAAHRTSVVA